MTGVQTCALPICFAVTIWLAISAVWRFVKFYVRAIWRLLFARPSNRPPAADRPAIRGTDLPHQDNLESYMINHVTPQVHSQRPAPDQQPGATIEILREEPCDSTRPGCMNCGISFNSLAPFRFCSCQQNLIVAISNRVTAQGPKKRPSYLADRRTFSDLLVVDPTDYNVHRHQWEENLLPKKREMYARHINDDRDPKRDKKHSVFVKVKHFAFRKSTKN